MICRYTRLLFAATALCFITPVFAQPQTGITLPADPNLRVLRALIPRDSASLDDALAKVTIDHMIDPTVDVQSTLKELDHWADVVQARLPAHATHLQKLLLLGSTIYEPGPWNDGHPFTYDLDDPFGRVIQNKLIATFLKTRKGNCVSMPMFVVILGQKLGLDVTLAAAPNHNLVKYRQDDGTWINIEATSGMSMADSDYQRLLDISPLGMRSGIYLRPLKPRQALGLMMVDLEDFYAKHRSPEHQLGLTALALELNPDDSFSIIRRADAFYSLLQTRYVKPYPQPDLIPPALRPDFEMLMRGNVGLFQRVEALGWHQPTNDEDAAYLKRIDKEKAKRGG